MKNNTDAMKALAEAGWSFEEIRGVLSPPAITYLPGNANPPIGVTNPVIIPNPRTVPVELYPTYGYHEKPPFSLPEGMLALTGNVSEESLQEFKTAWTDMRVGQGQ